MTKYYGQRDAFSCGSVAILNALVFLGFKVSYKNIPAISKEIGCVPIVGTQSGTKVTNFLRNRKIKFKRIVLPTFKEIDAHLDSGGAFILKYIREAYPEEDMLLGHYAFFEKRQGNYYYGSNITPKKNYEKITKRKMKKYMKHHREKVLQTNLPWAWFIFKDDK